MKADRFSALTARYPSLQVAVVGDFFLDRYLEIDPARAETSIETGLPVHNVVAVRGHPGAAGTIVNNLVALGIGTIYPVGFCGDDGEGYELRRALTAQRGVTLAHFLTSSARQTPVYCKPLIVEPGRLPRELNRLDSKNWTPTPPSLQRQLAERVSDLARQVDVLLLLDQVEVPDTGVATRLVSQAVHAALLERKGLTVLADSRRGVQHFPPLGFKMNAAELTRLTGDPSAELDAVKRRAAALAAGNGWPVFVTLADRGIVGAWPGRQSEHAPAHPVRGPIDVVGAGDAVTANLAAALAAGADVEEAMELAMAGASIVIHQLGTTGTASPGQIGDLLGFGPLP
jgi:rfaE bifunctional protein kinase chain/domain